MCSPFSSTVGFSRFSFSAFSAGDNSLNKCAGTSNALNVPLD